MFKWIVVVVVVVACLFAVVGAQALEHSELPASPAYEDLDPSAIALRAPPGRATDFRKRLNRAIQRDSGNVMALSHRAYLYLRTGNVDEALRDFNQALKSAEYGSPLNRQILWAYGWALYDLDRIDDAMKKWQLEVKLHGGKPFWAPYTYALAYWTAGEREVALAWYSTAVRSNAQWGNQAGFDVRTEHWRPRQREQQQALFDAWKTSEARRTSSH